MTRPIRGARTAREEPAGPATSAATVALMAPPLAPGGTTVAGRRFAAPSPNWRLALLIAGLLLIRLALYGWLAGGLPALPTALCHWDCDWYCEVARAGYAWHPKTLPGPTLAQANWAFFPVYPGLTATTARLLDIPTLTAAIVVANLGFCAFAFFAAKYLRSVDPAVSGPMLVVFLFAYPYSFWFSLPYTESVYAALAVVAFWFLERRRMLGASLAAAVLSATRVTGVMLAPVIAWPYLVALSRALRRRDPAAAAVSASLLPVALAPLGLFLFMLYLYVHTGDGLAFLHIQRAWSRSRGDPFATLWQGLTSFDLTRFSPRLQESQTFNALSALAGLLLSLRLLIMKRFAACWFLTTAILLPLSYGLDSLARYTLAQPLFMVFLFDAIGTIRSRTVFWTIIGLSALLQLFLVRLWMQGYAFLH